MGQSDSKTSEAKDNSNANNITIVQKLQEHGDALSIFLVIIITILILKFAYKLYVDHKRSIKKKAVRKSVEQL